MEKVESYSVKEAAEILGVSTRTINRRINDGSLTGVKTYSGKWKLSKKQIDEIVEQTNNQLSQY